MAASTSQRARRVGRPKNPPDPLVAERLRTFRQAAGLTQAQLAGRDFTKGFVSLVETRRSAVSLRAARIFAARLGVSVDDLLRPERRSSDRELELAMAHAEGDLAAGRYDEALRAVRPLEKARADLRARYLRLKGRVLLETDRAREAIPILDEALRLFRRQSDRERATRTLFDLARAYARMEAHGEAAHFGLQCEAAIVAGDVVDASLEMRLLAFLGGIFVTLGDVTSADLRMERARRLAEDIAEPRGVANLYYHLAVLRQRKGDPEAALRFATKALDAYEQLGVQAHVGSVWNTIGWIHLKSGRFAQAEQALTRAERIAAQSQDARLASYVVQNRAELALARGHAEEAVHLAQASIDHPKAPARARALSRLVKAQALARTGAPSAAVDRGFVEAARALRPFGKELVARAHKAHFEVLTAAGRQKDANRAAQAAFDALSTSRS